jgi:hypothetical protein
MGKMFSLAALIIACLFLVYYIAQPTYQRQIEAVLVADKNIGSDIKNASTVEDFSTSVQRMYSINLSNCPAKFQVAYRCHIDAWEKAIPVIKEVEELNGWGNVLRSFVVGLVGGYTGNFGMIAGKIAADVKAGGELKEEAARVDEGIKNTYDNVLKIAQEHGVDITPYTKN